MAIKERGRSFDAKTGIETVVLEDSQGRQHHLTIHVTPHEFCKACGRPMEGTPKGFEHVELVIERAKKAMKESERRMRLYQKQRKPLQ